MLDKDEVSKLLTRTTQLEKVIEDKKREQQTLSDKLIELKTKREQLILQLQEFGVKEDSLESEITRLYKEVQDGLTKFEEICSTEN